jgi:DNA polymerase IV
VTERLSERLKAKGIVGDTVTLKLKSAGFRLRTRARHLMIPTQLANVIYETGMLLLERELDGTAFRLIGIGVSGIDAADGNDPVDLLEPAVARKAAAERAMDRVRSRFGREAVVRGKLYKQAPAPQPEQIDDDQNEGKTR